jgi:UDP-N-acetyl-D-mannosaminuronic acid dehydrogenase
VAHCPERVRPGRIMIELISNDRVVGGLTPECARRAADVYALFCRGEILFTDAESAEMAKLVENSFRDVNIAFANELAGVCEHLGLDVWEIIRLANRHPRVNVLTPGPGVGGHCIAVDPWFIVAAAPDRSQLIRSAREINDARPHQVVASVVDTTNSTPGPIACLGLSFKADIDDLRESPALDVVTELADTLPDREILVVEPHLSELPTSLERANVTLVPLHRALREATSIVLLVDHRAFKGISLGEIEGKLLVDTRGVWSKKHY